MNDQETPHIPMASTARLTKLVPDRPTPSLQVYAHLGRNLFLLVQQILRRLFRLFQLPSAPCSIACLCNFLDRDLYGLRQLLIGFAELPN